MSKKFVVDMWLDLFTRVAFKRLPNGGITTEVVSDPHYELDELFTKKEMELYFPEITAYWKEIK